MANPKESKRAWHPAQALPGFRRLTPMVFAGIYPADAQELASLKTAMEKFALTDAAFHGRNREYALGNTPQQRYMGAWSDGRPVRELIVLDRP